MYLNAHRKNVFHIFQMSHDDYLLEVVFYGSNDVQDALSPSAILRAETFIYK